MHNDPLLQPFSIRHLHLRNRVVSTSHEPAYSEAGMPKRRYRDYLVEKARGGVGLNMFGGSAIVAPDSPPAFGNLEIYRDEIVPWFRDLSDAVHEHGSALMCQISHLGWRGSNFTGDWLPLIWPNHGREPAHRSFTKKAEEWDLARIIDQYASAALRCREGGLDGVEMEAYGHLLDAFWYPTNDRDDAWGGSLENRMRFSLEVVSAVRKAVGSDFIVGIRMVVDDATPGGLGEEEGLMIARTLQDHGIDFISVIKGRIDSEVTLSKAIPGMGTPSAPHLALAGAVKRTVTIPVMHAARISDVATARYALREGFVDLVGLTRPQIADPHLVAKVAAGQEDRIRPCVGASYCIDRIYISGQAHCLHNPAAGREALLPHEITEKSATPRKVLIVGAGPAGLEAARVAAERGHDVTVLEAAAQAGGQVRVAAMPMRRRELLGLVEWRVSECEHLGVHFRYNCFAGEDEVLAEAPDVVIIATGGLPNTEFLDAGNELVSSTWDVLSGDVKPSGDVLVFDYHGGHQAMSAAETLCERDGVSLELVTSERSLGPDVGGLNMPAYLRAFARHDVRQTLGHRVKAVARENGRLKVTLHDDYGELTRERIVDHVVVEHGTLPLDDLYFALRNYSTNAGELDQAAFVALEPQRIERNPDGRFQLFRIGDAINSRDIHAAIYDGMRLTLAL
ncbi:NADH:flavin oxidoreductase [Pseudomonas matsuisoli]|uniref:N-methylproline demethylase n=1 Tax=Pseudomonas matsuisoli TaxID=1515666 RepID=A0A917PY72_9PSED|nr:NADH:flavin oxidoreductase [Pseudomonas matsuisoli]GGJ98381.1 N-methylproline demethylase [Pseudomonas matsuisoli]